MEQQRDKKSGGAPAKRNHELNEEMGALKRKVEELDGRVAELEEREHGKDESVRL
jgi:predicted  nucleic acid-binding Zn-ribbon protein